jgi:hypothetical protein
MAVMLIIRLIKFRTYMGKLYLLPADEAAKHVLPADSKATHYGPCGKYTLPSSDNFTNWPTKIESTFQYFVGKNLIVMVGTNMPWLATDFQVCPHSKIDNGIMDLLFMEKTTRSSVLASFLDSERGVAMTLPGMRHYRLKAFVLDPGSYTVHSGGNKKSSQADLLEEPLSDLIMDISGERVPYGRIQVEVLPSLINIIVPDWYDPDRWQRNFVEDFPNAPKL